MTPKKLSFVCTLNLNFPRALNWKKKGKREKEREGNRKGKMEGRWEESKDWK